MTHPNKTTSKFDQCKTRVRKDMAVINIVVNNPTVLKLIQANRVSFSDKVANFGMSFKIPWYRIWAGTALDILYNYLRLTNFRWKFRTLYGNEHLKHCRNWFLGHENDVWDWEEEQYKSKKPTKLIIHWQPF